MAHVATLVALACPYCAGSVHVGLGGALLLGGFLLLPYPLAILVVRAIRKGPRGPRPPA